MGERVKIDISTATLLRIALFIGAIYLIYLLRDVIALLFVVTILVAAFRPVVAKWGRKIGYKLAVASLVLIFLGVIIGFIALIVPPLMEQTKQLIDQFPEYLNRLSALRSHFPTLEAAIKSLENISFGSGVVDVTTGFVGGLVSILTIIILTVYLLLDAKLFSNLLSRLIPCERHDEAADIIDKIANKVGNWLRGQLYLGLIIGTLVFVGLTIIGVPYALALGVIAALLEFIPVIGPFISGILAALIALSISPITALIVIIYFIVLQQLENNLIVPKIMQKAIGLPPAIIIITIIISSKLFGIIGAILAVPISGIIYVIYKDWNTIKRILRNEKRDK